MYIFDIHFFQHKSLNILEGLKLLKENSYA